MFKFLVIQNDYFTFIKKIIKGKSSPSIKFYYLFIKKKRLRYEDKIKIKYLNFAKK